MGEVATWSADIRARNITRAASGALTYSPTTNAPFTFVDGTLEFGSDTVVKLKNVEITGNNNTNYYYTLGSRLLQQPTTGTRRYDFTFTVQHSDDATASSLSGVELRELLFGTAGSTTPETGGLPTPCGDLTLTLTEGTGTGDRTIIIQLEDCYFEEIGEPIEMSDTGGPIELNVTGFALSALTNGADKTFMQFYTHT
jgi:hypothetical protein